MNVSNWYLGFLIRLQIAAADLLPKRSTIRHCSRAEAKEEVESSELIFV